MKKFFGSFLMLFGILFVVFLVSSNNTKALYEDDKNYVSVTISQEAVTINVTYQRGFDKDFSYYSWCDKGNASNRKEDCVGYVEGTENIKYASSSMNAFISKASANEADSNLTTQTFVIGLDTTITDPILRNINNYKDKNLVLKTTTYFCTVRNVENYGECQYFTQKTSYVDVSINDLQNDIVIGSIENIEDEGLKSVMEKVSNIVYTTILPIIWAVLGLILVIKGSMLGVQIVKSADEPQVRQEKIGSLKWLVIGVAIAAFAAGGVQVLTGYFSGAFK